VRTCLRKRATAPRRIGVTYRARRMDGCTMWLPPELADLHGAWFAAASDPPRMNDIP
jgi:hypothetical protein